MRATRVSAVDAAQLADELEPGLVVLLKASRGAALEDVLAGLPVQGSA